LSTDRACLRLRGSWRLGESASALSYSCSADDGRAGDGDAAGVSPRVGRDDSASNAQRQTGSRRDGESEGDRANREWE
jgi:hypothetical protein